MFNTVIQPTGVYGTYPQLSGGANIPPVQTQTNVQSVLEQPQNTVATPKKPKKKLALLPKLVLLAGAAVAFVWGIPALRAKICGGNMKEKPLNKLFLNKFGEPLDVPLKKLRTATVKFADKIDEKLRTPAKKFLQENVFAFKARIRPEDNYLNL